MFQQQLTKMKSECPVSDYSDPHVTRKDRTSPSDCTRFSALLSSEVDELRHRFNEPFDRVDAFLERRLLVV